MSERLKELLEEHEGNLENLDLISVESFKHLYESVISELVEIIEEAE